MYFNQIFYKLSFLQQKMGFENIFWWPFVAAFGGAIAILAVFVLIFWIWMIVDCAKRKFKNDIEKIVWILVIVLATWLGAFIYFIVIKTYNPRGIIKK